MGRQVHLVQAMLGVRQLAGMHTWTLLLLLLLLLLPPP